MITFARTSKDRTIKRAIMCIAHIRVSIMLYHTGMIDSQTVKREVDDLRYELSQCLDRLSDNEVVALYTMYSGQINIAQDQLDFEQNTED